MDIAKAFEVLSQGKIISSNSAKNSEVANMLLAEPFFDEVNELVNKIGYKLIGENGYFYMAKKGRLTVAEQQLYINKNRDLIVAVAFLRRLYPRLDRGDIFSFVDAAANYANTKNEDSSIRDHLVHFPWVKNKDNEKGMLEQLFKHLEDRGVLEKPYENNTDQYKVLDAINYYISLVESVEKGDE